MLIVNRVETKGNKTSASTHYYVLIFMLASCHLVVTSSPFPILCRTIA